MIKYIIIGMMYCAIYAANWSDPATWGGAVPAAGSAVVIPHGQSVVLDTSVEIASLELHGRLEVARQDVSITAGFIMLHGGELVAGSVVDPFAQKLTITLTGTDRTVMPGLGGRGIGVMGGGRLELIGAVPTLSWTMLAPGYTANVGDTIITTESATGWQVGNEIIITSTDFDYAQTEQRTITGITGNTIILSESLRYLHYGVITHVPHGVAGVPTTIDERAEVGLLSHNIKIKGADDAETANGYGGHVMVMDDASVALLQGVEFFRMGQFGLLGRYPIHWHNMNDGGSNSWIRFSSIHHSFNRGITLHKASYVTVSDNVVYDVKGHGVFFEDGKETGNVLTRNLVALVHKGPIDINFAVSDSSTPNAGFPAAFWISNPNNTFINNASAGVCPGGIGFWYDLHSVTRPGSISDDPNYRPNAQPFGAFRGNRAHSVALPFNGTGLGEVSWGLFIDDYLGPTQVVIEDFTTFKNQVGQVWMPKNGSVRMTITRSRLSGERVLFNYHWLKDSIAVGRTGNPVVIDPDAWMRNINLTNYDPSLALMALSGYDFVGTAEGSVFANYRGVFALRRTGEVGSKVTNCTFINDATYRTYLIGNVHGLNAAEAEQSLFTIENPEDSFGNGAPGMFTYTVLNTNSGSKKAATGAKGIDPADDLQWWTPFVPPPPPPPPPTTSPSDVDVATYGLQLVSINSAQATITASIRVRTRTGAAAPGITVTFVWRGIVEQTVTGITNQFGSVSFTVRPGKIRGNLTGEITNLSGVYDPAIYVEPVSRSVLVQR